MKRYLTSSAAVIPYAAVALGLYVLENAWAAILLYHAGITIVLAGRRGELGGVLFRGWDLRIATTGAVVGALAGTLIFLLWDLIHIEGLSLGVTLEHYGLHGVRWVAFVLYFIVVHPLMEEAFWRYHLMRTPKRPHWLDAAFAGYHVPVLLLFITPAWTVLSFVLLAGVAWVWRVLSDRSGGLAIPVFMHAAADLSIMCAVWVIAARTSGG
ncbi:MAG: CPBP family glutamic-type intramembrane protease [bacterium]|nr:CPBP family glutamic-type intramembrane protease [bacterium]